MARVRQSSHLWAMKRNIQVRRTTPHPTALWLLKTVLWVLAISALIPGMELMHDPTGKGVGFPEGYLAGAPFPNYFIPGLLLTVFVGVLSLAAWWALWKKPASAFCQRLSPFPDTHWAWALALASGLVLMTWIIVQVLMVPYFFLQPLLFVWGASIVLLCFSKGVRAYYRLSVSRRATEE